MIILDTDVISEFMRPRPARSVLEWSRTQSLRELATTSISLAEIRHGLARLSFGRRRRELEARFNALLSRGFASRVFDFDAAAADAYGDVMVARERAGRRLEGCDGLIAAIAKSRNLPVATRNLDDFSGCGIDVISPWNDASSTL